MDILSVKKAWFNKNPKTLTAQSYNRFPSCNIDNKHFIGKAILNKGTILILASFLISPFTFGQENNNYLLWSAGSKLTDDDFAIKIRQLETTTSFAQFSVNCKVNGFDFLTKNFNKKVRNYLIRYRFMVDITADIKQTLTYQQTLFDICWIYTRQI